MSTGPPQSDGALTKTCLEAFFYFFIMLILVLNGLCRYLMSLVRRIGHLAQCNFRF